MAGDKDKKKPDPADEPAAIVESQGDDQLPKGAEPPIARNFDRLNFNMADDPSPIYATRHPGALGLDYAQLDEIANVPYLANIISTRANQIAGCCKPQTTPYSGGLWVGLRDRKAKMSRAAEKRAAEILRMLMDAGGRYGMGGIDLSIRAMVPDTLGLDQINFEPLRTRGGQVYGWRPHDATTFRIAKPSPEARNTGHNYPGERDVAVVQKDASGRVVEEFGWHEMAWGIRRPRTRQTIGRYGHPEADELAPAIATLLSADASNANAITNGVHASMFIALHAALDPKQWDAFRRTMTASLTGIRNAGKTPFIQLIPGKNEKLEVIPVETHTNKEMQYMEWRRAMIQLIFAAYQMDPAEAGYSFGNEGQKSSLGTSSPEARIAASQERGLVPLLSSFGHWLSVWFVQLVDPDFLCELTLGGMDPDTRMKLALDALGGFKTVNETRVEWDMKKLDSPAADMVMSPTYVQAMASASAPAMGEDEADLPNPDMVAPEEDGFAEDVVKGPYRGFDRLTRDLTASAEAAMRDGRLVPRGRYRGTGRKVLVPSSEKGVRAWIIEAP